MESPVPATILGRPSYRSNGDSLSKNVRGHPPGNMEIEESDSSPLQALPSSTQPKQAALNTEFSPRSTAMMFSSEVPPKSGFDSVASAAAEARSANKIIPALELDNIYSGHLDYSVTPQMQPKLPPEISPSPFNIQSMW